MSDELAEQAVDAINDLSGRHPGHRAAHARGVLLTGEFRATDRARELTRAVHLSGEPVRATVRFSNGSGNPEAPDYERDGQGLAVKLYLADGTKTDFVGLSLPVFFVRTVEDFIEFTRSRKPDPETGNPDPEKVGPFIEAHPEVLPAIQAALSAEPPASYATRRYNGIHAFRWTNADGESRYVRYRWEPEAGEESVSFDEAKERGGDFLRPEIVERAERETVAFRLVVQIAEDGDPIDDPTAAWPEERETVEVGRLVLTGPETEREQGDDILVFDPTRVVDGVECSDDPILNFRPKAYSVSVERRSGAPAPA